MLKIIRDLMTRPEDKRPDFFAIKRAVIKAHKPKRIPKTATLNKIKKAIASGKSRRKEIMSFCSASGHTVDVCLEYLIAKNIVASTVVKTTSTYNIYSFSLVK